MLIANFQQPLEASHSSTYCIIYRGDSVSACGEDSENHYDINLVPPVFSVYLLHLRWP